MTRELVVYCTNCEQPVIGPDDERGLIVDEKDNHAGLMSLISVIDRSDSKILEHCKSNCHYGDFEIRQKQVVTEVDYMVVDEI